MEPQAAHRNATRVLVIDDDIYQRQSLCAILEDEDFDVIGCATGAEALARMADGEIDVAIADLHLPDVAEEQLLNIPAGLAGNVALIIHTGYGSYESAKQAVNIGAFAYVEKGGDPAELVRHVHRAVESRPVRQAEDLDKIVAERTSELRRANAMLRRTQADLYRAQRIARVGSWEWNVRTGAAAWSDETFRLFGFEPGDVEPSYDTARASVHPEDLDAWTDAVMSAVESGDRFQFEYRAIHRDGTTIWIRNEAEIVRDDSGRASRFFGTAQDVTEWRRLNAALIASEARFRAFVENANDVVYSLSLEGTFTYVSPNVRFVLGYDAATLQDTPFADYLHPDDTSRCNAFLQHVVSTGGSVSGIEYRVRHQDGGWRWHTSNVSPLKNREGKIVEIIGIDRDDTKRKKVEEELRLRDRAVNAAAEGISITDQTLPDQPVVFVNRGFEDMTGYLAEEVLGRNMRFLQGPATDPATVEQLRQAIAEGRTTTIEIQNHRKDGSTFWNRLVLTPVRDDLGEFTHYIGIHTDVTGRITQQHRMALSLDVLKHLNTGKPTHGLMDEVLRRLRDCLGVEAAGIRLRHGDDFPYVATAGFPGHFVEQERYLLARDASGKLVRDATGGPVLECMCGNVICGRTNPLQPFFSDGGSFWTNSTTELLATATENQLQARTHNRCHGEGYESVALIPLRSDGKTMGILQLNDRRPGRFSPELIAFLEGLGHSIGIALHRSDSIAALEESEARYRSLVENSLMGVNVFQDGKFVFANRTMAAMLGYSAVELCSLGPDDLRNLVHPDDRELLYGRAEARLAGANPPSRYSYRMLRKDGSVVWLEHAVSVGTVNGRPAVQAFVQDISEQRALEARLHHTRKMEAIGQLAAGIAHEFNNLLFVILGGVEAILTTQQGALAEYTGGRLRDIKKCAQRGATLTRQLLTFASNTGSGISVFNLHEMLDEFEVVLRQLLGARIRLEKVLTPDLPCVRAARAEVEQAVLNMARNAYDAMPDGGTFTIQTAAERFDEPRVAESPHARPGPYVLLSVADTGCGMTSETMERIFEPFFTTKPAGEGTGLGLSTAYADITKSGGTIEVKSQPGKGTVFFLYLPAAGQDDVAAPAEDGRVAEDAEGGGHTILVCDDDEIVLRSASFLLQSYGYSVISALGPGEAVKAAQSHTGTIDLLLTDVMMSPKNGWELAQELVAERPQMGVIFMSGYAADVLEAGATAETSIKFFQKGADNDVLARCVREVLDAPHRSAP